MPWRPTPTSTAASARPWISLRFLEADTLLADRDHLLGRKTDFGIRFIGVVSAGFIIVDTSEGAADWALNKAQGPMGLCPGSPDRWH